MKLSDFDFTLPDALIARYPLPERTASRLLSLDGNTGQIQHRKFADILAWLEPNDCLILNNTRVIPARLYGQKATGGRIEILIERIVNPTQAIAHIRANKAIKSGTLITISPAYTLEVLTRNADDLWEVQLHGGDTITHMLDQFGEIPLPPYMERAPELSDNTRYQTVYAAHPGAVAAPTAGLHFDEAFLAAIQAKGVAVDYVTLHVGAGTFQPVRVEDLSQHRMHSEYLEVPAHVCATVEKTRRHGGRVIAVGTTVVRSLETAAQTGKLMPYQGESRLFIYPPYDFHVVDILITNFHLPKSSLLMLVSAFAGYEQVMHAYQVAIDAQYRFFSYGDAMWVTRRKRISD